MNTDETQILKLDSFRSFGAAGSREGRNRNKDADDFDIAMVALAQAAARCTDHLSRLRERDEMARDEVCPLRPLE